MWTALLTITMIASIGFALAAALSTQTKDAASQGKTRRSLRTARTTGCRNLSWIACAAFEPKSPPNDEASVCAGKTEPIDTELPSVTLTTFLEPALLPRRMRLLQIDLEEFFCTEPLLFRELATRCRQCSSANRCEQDLSDPWTSPSDHAWTDYCPSASVLNAISTFQARAR